MGEGGSSFPPLRVKLLHNCGGGGGTRELHVLSLTAPSARLRDIFSLNQLSHV